MWPIITSAAGKTARKNSRKETKKRLLASILLRRMCRAKNSPIFMVEAPSPSTIPNEWDKRHGRSGFGIWLHGTPSDTYSRAAYAQAMAV